MGFSLLAEERTKERKKVVMSRWWEEDTATQEEQQQPTITRRSRFTSATGWEKFLYYVTFSCYALLNSIDMVLSGCLTVFAVELAGTLSPIQKLPFYISWIIWIYAIIGSSILVEVFLSFSALAFVTCRPVAYIPQHMTYIIATVSFITGVIAFVIERIFFNFMTNHAFEYGIGQRDIASFRSYYKYAAAILLSIIPPLQACRFFISQRFTLISRRIDGEFHALLDDHDRSRENQLHFEKEARREKYDSLRGYYHAKYDSVY